MEYNELNHHGVKGQKWGVRRYQNPDGSLTDAGKKRIATKAGYYLNPEYGDKNSVNRRAVSKAYMNAYDELMRKHDIDASGMDAAEAARKLEAKTGQKNLDDKLWNSFLDKYAEATLKDLGYENVAKAKEYVQELFRSDLIDLDELRHHGILGMKWGQRRFQNKDGSLTPAGKKRYSDDEPEETTEEKRSRLLKSTNARELYKNRSLLSTAEINERLNRIDTERRLGEVAAKTKKTGMQRVEKALQVARKVDEVYKFANESAIGKALKKKLGLEKVEKRLGLEEAYNKRDKLDTNKLKEVLNRARTENDMKKLIESAGKESGVKIDREEVRSIVDQILEERENNK